jgi:hypothetical protein
VTETTRLAGRAIVVLAGYLVWSLALVAVYATHGVLCALAAAAPSTVRLLAIGVWLVHVALGIGVTVWLRTRARVDFLAGLAFALALTGAIATAWTGLPLLYTEACRPAPLP